MRQSARGFAQITPGRLSILTDMVAGEGEIDEDATAMEAGLKPNLAMLGVKRRRRSA